MRKLLSLLCGLLILMMMGCGVETAPETTAPPETVVVEIPYETEADARPYVGVELTFCAALAETDPQVQVLTQAAEVFEKQTGAVVTFRRAADQAAAGQALAEGTADIVRVPLDALTENASAALDLTELAARAGYESHSFDALRQQVTSRCGTLAAIPCAPELVGIYYNADVFREAGILQAPADWESFLTVCGILAGEGWQPLAMNTEDMVPALQLHLGLNEALTEEQAAELGQQIVELLDAGYVQFADAPGGQNKLALSNAVMTLGSNADCARIEEETCTDLNWGVFCWPGGAAYGMSEVLAVASGCEAPQAAFDFVMLLTTGEFDQLRADVTGGIPADPSNESVIAGAVEALAVAGAQEPDVLSDAKPLVAQKLWQGKYKSGKVFADIWDQIE